MSLNDFFGLHVVGRQASVRAPGGGPTDMTGHSVVFGLRSQWREGNLRPCTPHPRASYGPCKSKVDRVGDGRVPSSPKPRPRAMTRAGPNHSVVRVRTSPAHGHLTGSALRLLRTALPSPTLTVGPVLPWAAGHGAWGSGAGA